VTIVSYDILSQRRSDTYWVMIVLFITDFLERFSSINVTVFLIQVAELFNPPFYASFFSNNELMKVM